MTCTGVTGIFRNENAKILGVNVDRDLETGLAARRLRVSLIGGAENGGGTDPDANKHVPTVLLHEGGARVKWGELGNKGKGLDLLRRVLRISPPSAEVAFECVAPVMKSGVPKHDSDRFQMRQKQGSHPPH